MVRNALQLAFVLICVTAAADKTGPMKVDVQPDDLLVSPPESNWISYNGDYTGRRYSKLSEVNLNKRFPTSCGMGFSC